MRNPSSPVQESATAASSLSLVSDSDQAFTLRVTLARLATRTLDLQYYIWDDDTTGKLLIFVAIVVNRPRLSSSASPV